MSSGMPTNRATDANRCRHQRPPPASRQIARSYGHMQSQQFGPTEETDAAEQEERCRVQHNGRGEAGEGHLRKTTERRRAEET